MSLNQSLNIAVSSLRNNQYALTVVSQNIANVNVEGYARQRVNFETNPYTTNCENVLSTIRGMNGASIASLTNFLDEDSFNTMINANSDAAYYNTMADALSGLEDIADALGDNGLNGLLNDFYTAAAQLEQYPTDITIRQQFIQSAQNVCEKFNSISNQYNNLLDDTVQNVDGGVDKINELLSELAQANKEHVLNNKSIQTQTQIDSILTELSNYLDITTDKNPNGSYNLYIGNVAVVQGGEVEFTLQANIDKENKDGSIVSYFLQSTKDEDLVLKNGITESIKSGSLKAYNDFLNGTNTSFVSLSKMMNSLDEAASAFAVELNAIQTYNDGNSFAASLETVDGELVLTDKTVNLISTKDNPTGVVEYDLITGDVISPSYSAANIRVNSDMFENPYLVAASRIDKSKYTDEMGNVDESWKLAIGNSDNATEFTAMQNKPLVDVQGNKITLSQFLINNAAQAGLDAANAQNKAEIYDGILDNATTDYSNIIGVNLDEELADLIRYQRSYEASAKVFSTVNGLFDVVLSMV